METRHTITVAPVTVRGVVIQVEVSIHAFLWRPERDAIAGCVEVRPTTVHLSDATGSRAVVLADTRTRGA